MFITTNSPTRLLPAPKPSETSTRACPSRTAPTCPCLQAWSKAWVTVMQLVAAGRWGSSRQKGTGPCHMRQISGIPRPLRPSKGPHSRESSSSSLNSASPSPSEEERPLSSSSSTGDQACLERFSLSSMMQMGVRNELWLEAGAGGQAACDIVGNFRHGTRYGNTPQHVAHARMRTRRIESVLDPRISPAYHNGMARVNRRSVNWSSVTNSKTCGCCCCRSNSTQGHSAGMECTPAAR